MSALGHKRTSGHVRVMSALPPKADIKAGPSYARSAHQHSALAHPCCMEGGLSRQTPSEGTKTRMLYFGPVLIPSPSYRDRYQTIASPTGFAVLIIASGGTGYHSPSMGTQYSSCLIS